jgi:(4-alkanoyl-5-oxo-2,5-dihydrofuran-3-yl)methyl phosphate reductase
LEAAVNYLITGATGDVGSKVVTQLIERGERPRVFVRNAAKARALFGDQAEIFPGDLADDNTLRAAMDGVDAVFLVNSGPRIPELDRLAADAAKAAGVKLLVKLSSLDAEEDLALGAWHARGEAAIRASGVPFTFVRPSGFMSNLLAWTHSIQSEGVVRSSTGAGRRPFIHSEDIAAVAVEALTSGKYEGQCLPLTGPEALTFDEITARISTAVGRSLRYEAIGDKEAERRFAATGASAEEVAAHIELWRAIRKGRLAKVTDGVERVLGRKPIGLDQWLAENIVAFRN